MIDAKHYQDALLAQSACNLSGVVYSFAKVMEEINKQAQYIGQGTDWKNQHAICRLYAEQIMHLTSGRDYHEAYKAAVLAVETAGLPVP